MVTICDHTTFISPLLQALISPLLDFGGLLTGKYLAAPFTEITGFVIIVWVFLEVVCGGFSKEAFLGRQRKHVCTFKFFFPTCSIVQSQIPQWSAVLLLNLGF